MADDLSKLEMLAYSGEGLIVGLTPSGSMYMGLSITTAHETPGQKTFIKGNNDSSVIVEDSRDLGKPVIREVAESYPALFVPKFFASDDNALIGGNGLHTHVIYSSFMSQPDKVKGVSKLRKVMSTMTDEHHYLYCPSMTTGSIDLTCSNLEFRLLSMPRLGTCIVTNAKGGGASVGIFASRWYVFGPDEGKLSRKNYYSRLAPGQGKLITTHEGFKNEFMEPLVFTGEPREISIVAETADEIANMMYAARQQATEAYHTYNIGAAAILLKKKMKPEEKIMPEIAIIGENQNIGQQERR